MMIDRETQQKIKDAANIVDVVGDYVKLTRRGANYMGLCPFHNERTPSFSVSPRLNFCQCFSCKKGGSPVNFLMEKEGIGYTEALLLLAKKYGIPVQEREMTDEERERLSERESMLVASEWAMNRFHDNLYNTEEGRQIGLAYLYSRGITDEAIKKFRLGYSIDRGDALISAARNEGFDIDVFQKIGLVGQSQQGRIYDKFRGRVMFPIRNASGKPVAFGGRTLKGDAAKYINSPETPLYKKSNELYGIFEAKGDIIKQERVFLMEGYLDVIGSWQAGLKNVVASSGTALTESQIALIHRFTDNVTLIYDGDSAGIKASLRGIDMLLSQKLHVKVLLLPDGEDPDSFARKNTPEDFQKYIGSHQTDFIHFKLSVLLNEARSDPQQISDAVRSIVRSIACIPDEIERISYIKECAKFVDIEDSVIARQVAQAMLEMASVRSKNQFSQNFNSSVNIISETGQREANPSGECNVTPAGVSSFFRQEEEIIRCCVRYGFLSFALPPEEPRKVIDYISEEMEADGIEFTYPAFKKIFNLLTSRKEIFLTSLNRYQDLLESSLGKEREEFREVLRITGGTMAKIKREEDKFAKEEEMKRNEALKQFAMDFSINFLVNHEDEEIRSLVNPMVAERHVLSSIYSKGGSETLLEENKLAELVPRALSELRSEILNAEVKKLQDLAVEAIRQNDTAQENEIMSRLAKLLYVRSRIAENLGERIISPR